VSSLDERARERRRKRHALEDRAVFVVKAAVLAAVIYGFTTMSAAPLTITCRGCHSDTRASHQAAAHSDLSCNACHSGTTLADRLDFRVRYARMVTSQILFRPSGGTVVTNATCAGCHTMEIASTFSAPTGVRISHQQKIAGGYQCTDCHSTTGHALSGAAERRPDMFVCLSCHNTLENARCESCHTEEREARPHYVSEWRLTHGANWRSLHGMGELATCNICHVPSYCARCHGVELPHPSGYLARHGNAVLAPEARQVCFDCHDNEQFCFACHQVEMPHPEGFLRGHLETSPGTEERCLRCHQDTTCTACHTQHVHPGIPPDILSTLRDRLGLE